MTSAVDTLHTETVSASTESPIVKAEAPTAKRSKAEVLVPAKASEIIAVHGMVMDAVTASPHYGEAFKAFESGRLTVAYLLALHRADPRHVMTIRENGELAGFILSGPEFGVLWQYWSYLDPAHRSGTLAMRVMRLYQSVWQNDRFHKILTYSRPENKVSIALMERYGYTRVAELKQHLFGEDYLLYEYQLNRGEKAYDQGIGIGLRTKLAAFALRYLPFLFR